MSKLINDLFPSMITDKIREANYNASTIKFDNFSNPRERHYETLHTKIDVYLTPYMLRWY